jgi:hypothetical protein
MSGPAVIFLGPSLPVAEARQQLDAVFLPPVRQGDVHRTVQQLKPAVIGIIDGYFHQMPAVWHREILWAMTAGVHVLGAASMGALRAAELAPFGMRGVGRIFEAYRDGHYTPFADPFEDDDEVAVIHGPAELGFVAVSEAMVDIRDVLARAGEAGVIDAAFRDRLAGIGKAMPYRERTLARILKYSAADGADADALARLTAWLPRQQTSRKRLDAELLLREAQKLREDYPGPMTAPFRFEPAAVWCKYVADSAGPQLDPSDLEQAALDELRLRPSEWQAHRRGALMRRAGIERGRGDGGEPGDGAVRASLDRLRRERGLTTRALLDAWMRENGLDEPSLLRLMAEEAALDVLPQRPGRIAGAVADELRLAGRFRELAARGTAKRRWAEAAGVAGRRPSELELSDLLDWFTADRLGNPLDGAPPAAELAVRLGFSDIDEFAAALWLEWAYTCRADGEPPPADAAIGVGR